MTSSLRLIILFLLLGPNLFGQSNVWNLKYFTTDNSQIQLDQLKTKFDSVDVQNRLYYNAGVSDDYTWILLKANDVSYNKILQFSNPNIDEIIFFQLAGDSILQIDSNVNISKPDGVAIYNSLPTLNIHQLANTILIRTSSNKLNNALLIINNQTDTEKQNYRRDIIVSIYAGVLLIMLLYNLFLFVSTREKSYIWYILFLFAVGGTQLTLQGVSYSLFGTIFPIINKYLVHIFGALSGLTTALFVNFFLRPKSYSKIAYATILAIIFVDIVALVCIPFNATLAYILIDANAGLGSLAVLIVASYIAYKGSRSAKFFLLAWSFFLVAVIVYVLKDTGAVPYNNFTVNVLLFGSAIEVSLLSFALADKINIYRKEKDVAQFLALKAAQENEHIIREQNVILEQKVNERTTDLQKSNLQLEATLFDLKQTQTQMVEQEKMASLGQLTAGIAHEINNPINFVTSNVRPLKRDIDLIIEMNNRIEEVSSTGLDAEIKKESIAKIKTEFEFTYLVQEIDFLLKGIEEGSKRTAEIVKGLRIFSRVDEDDIKFADIHEGLDSTLIITNNLLDNKIEIIKDYCIAPKIECYPGKLNQVFLNIISNGIYAIKEKFGDTLGGIISISTRMDNQNFIIELKDNGVGMSSETKRKIFEPFYTTKPVGEGTGLGMSIVYNTIAKHNGTISVESELGSGTNFIINIPINRVKNAS
jgi:two-component system, NtrC family, sensor kinase